jgi:phosphatidylglycerophosphate synthase
MTTLTLKERWIFSVLLPICALIVGYFLVLATTDGEGSTIGFRAIGALIALPVVVLTTFVGNFLIAFPWKKSRSSSFAVGMVVPVLAVIVEYVYLWQVWKQYPDIG